MRGRWGGRGAERSRQTFLIESDVSFVRGLSGFPCPAATCIHRGENGRTMKQISVNRMVTRKKNPPFTAMPSSSSHRGGSDSLSHKTLHNSSNCERIRESRVECNGFFGFFFRFRFLDFASLVAYCWSPIGWWCWELALRSTDSTAPIWIQCCLVGEENERRAYLLEERTIGVSGVDERVVLVVVGQCC